MADSTAHVTWSGSLFEGSGTIDTRRKWRVRGAAGELERANG